MTEKSFPSNKRLVYWAGGLSIFTLIAHAIDAPDHLSEWWVYGTIFLVIGAFQFFYGLALFIRPWRFDDSGNLRSNADSLGRQFYILGIVLVACEITLYLVTRITGMPFLGPDAKVEPVTPLSLLPIITNLPLLFCLVRLLMQSRTRYDATIKNI